MHILYRVLNVHIKMLLLTNTDLSEIMAIGRIFSIFFKKTTALRKEGNEAYIQAASNNCGKH